MIITQHNLRERNQLCIKDEEEILQPSPYCCDAPSHANALSPKAPTCSFYAHPTDLARTSIQHHNFSLSQPRGMSLVYRPWEDRDG